jgi:hypothetical protein
MSKQVSAYSKDVFADFNNHPPKKAEVVFMMPEGDLEEWKSSMILELHRKTQRELRRIHKLTPEMIQYIYMPGFWPMSVNQLIGANKFAKQHAKEEQTEAIRTFAHLAGARPATCKRRVSTSLYLGAKGQKKRGRNGDVDNSCKVLFDALVTTGLLLGDNELHCEQVMPVMKNEGFPETGGYGTVIVLEDIVYDD